MIALLLGVLAGCGTPPACAAMCDRATDRRAECLGERDWTDLGYEDAADYRAWCGTWVWEQRLLERDAGERGRTEALCAERSEEIPDLSCEDYDAITW